MEAMNARAPLDQLPSAQEIYEMIAQSAYYRAQKRGFAPGLEAEDWREAEAEVMERLRAGRAERTAEESVGDVPRRPAP